MTRRRITAVLALLALYAFEKRVLRASPGAVCPITGQASGTRPHDYFLSPPARVLAPRHSSQHPSLSQNSENDSPLRPATDSPARKDGSARLEAGREPLTGGTRTALPPAQSELSAPQLDAAGGQENAVLWRSHSELRALSAGDLQKDRAGEGPLSQTEFAIAKPRWSPKNGSSSPVRIDPALIAREEEKMGEVWDRYRDQSEAVRRYEKDWSNTPELARLSAAYGKDHDPVAFMRGLSGSAAFRELALKYSTSPVMISLLKDWSAAASAPAMRMAMDVTRSDRDFYSFVGGMHLLVKQNGGLTESLHQGDGK